MDTINIIVMISIIASFSVILKKYAPEYSILINIFLGFAVIIYLISYIAPIFDYIKNLINLAKIPTKYVSVLFKSLGICFISQFASDSCKDAGEISLASKIEFIGKIAMITVSLPLFEEITNIAISFMGAK